MMHANYLIIAGSTRPGRRSPAIAQWVATLGDEAVAVTAGDAAFRVIDLLDLKLGFDDEPGIPAMGGYTRASTENWSALVSGAKGVVFVSPQYNWGYPAPLKNAIDHLYREWRGKPALIVTYGSHGGGKCAAQLREILGGLNLNLTEAMPGLRLGRDRIEANDGGIDPDVDFDAQRDEVKAALRELIALPAVEPKSA